MKKERMVSVNLNLRPDQLDWLEKQRRKNGDRSISETLRKILDKVMFGR